MRFLVVAFFFAGCGEMVTSTTVRLHNPSQVVLEAGPEHDVVLPPGRGERVVPLGAGRLHVAGDDYADYDVSAARNPDGTMELTWNVRLAASQTKHDPLWPEDHTFSAGVPARDFVPTGDMLRLDQCSSLWPSRFRGSFTGTYVVSGHTRLLSEPFLCRVGEGNVAYTLVTPWNNVAEIRETSTPQWKNLARALTPVNVLLLGGGGLLAGLPGSNERRAGGGVLLGLGVAISVPIIMALVRHEHVKTYPLPFAP